MIEFHLIILRYDTLITKTIILYSSRSKKNERKIKTNKNIYNFFTNLTETQKHTLEDFLGFEQ